MVTSLHGNNFFITGPFWGESTCQVTPHRGASTLETLFSLSWTLRGYWTNSWFASDIMRDAMALMWCYCKVMSFSMTGREKHIFWSYRQIHKSCKCQIHIYVIQVDVRMIMKLNDKSKFSYQFLNADESVKHEMHNAPIAILAWHCTSCIKQIMNVLSDL